MTELDALRARIRELEAKLEIAMGVVDAARDVISEAEPAGDVGYSRVCAHCIARLASALYPAYSPKWPA